MNQLFGALVVSAAALTIAALFLVFQLELGKIRLFTNPVGMWFLLGAGAAAFSIDYFTLQAYSRGLPISVGAPIGIACVPNVLTDETAPESGVKGRLISERYEPMPT